MSLWLRLAYSPCELKVNPSSRRSCACVGSICVFKLSNMNISATNRPIPIKFYLKHHLGGGKADLGFGPDRTRTLVSMATDNSHIVIMGENLVAILAPSFLIGSSSFL